MRSVVGWPEPGHGSGLWVREGRTGHHGHRPLFFCVGVSVAVADGLSRCRRSWFACVVSSSRFFKPPRPTQMIASALLTS